METEKKLEATILVRRRLDTGAQAKVEQILRGESEPIPREQARALLGADPADLQRIADFAASSGLTVTETSSEERTVRVSGTLAQLQALTIPAAMADIVVAVLGVDQRPVAKPRS